jgi:hypothetical protein
LIPQARPTHVALPWTGTAHTMPHAPQLFGSLVRSTHEFAQRVGVAPAQPEVQVCVPALEEHTGVAPAHALVQLPHVVAASSRVSQPGAGVQSPRPGVHASPHIPAVHVAAAPGAAGHAWSHAPQWSALAVKSVSQPSAGLALQSPKPLSHCWIAHCPPVHAAVAWARLQCAPHVPQFKTSVERSTSQPLSGKLWSQSSKPSRQALVHAPPLHAVCGHAWPQAPQWSGSLRVSTQRLSQHAWPAGQTPHGDSSGTAPSDV